MMQFFLNIVLQAAAVTAVSRDYATAYQETTDSGRPLVVLVGSDWCPGCRQMKQAAIPELEKKGGLSDVSFAYVNPDQQGELAGRLMHGSAIPQLIMYHKTEAGWKRQQLTGAHAVSEIQSFIKQGVETSAPKLSQNQ